LTEYRYKNQVLRIVPDNDPQSPREWDNLGTMICTHSRYNLGDTQKDPVEYLTELGLTAKDIVYLPLYLYDHSGLTMSTGDFKAFDPQGFDSGLVGIIYVSKEKIKSEYNVKRITKKTLEKVYSMLNSEVEIYNDYLSGNVWGFTLTEEIQTENQIIENLIDSCYGFYGSDPDTNGIKDHVENFEKFEDF